VRLRLRLRLHHAAWPGAARLGSARLGLAFGCCCSSLASLTRHLHPTCAQGLRPRPSQPHSSPNSVSNPAPFAADCASRGRSPSPRFPSFCGSENPLAFAFWVRDHHKRRTRGGGAERRRSGGGASSNRI
jgi:hypothetical protein